MKYIGLKTVRIGLIGDFDPQVIAHQAIPRALALAAAHLDVEVRPTWLATEELAGRAGVVCESMDGLWCVPASPYKSMEGALGAIRYARERQRPFLGTCGGFQHAVIEYARDVLHMSGADHAETYPNADTLLVTPLACSLVGKNGLIRLETGSKLHGLYGRREIEEAYHCSFGFNSEYRKLFETAGVRFTGFDENEEIRCLEVSAHPFFIATLFQPERSSLRGEINPLVCGFVKAAVRVQSAVQSI